MKDKVFGKLLPIQGDSYNYSIRLLSWGR